MKVIQIMDNFSASGGVNNFVYDLCFALKDAGCDVSLIGILNLGIENNSQIKQLVKKGIRVENLKAISKKDAIFHHIRKLRGLIKEISAGENCICNLHLKLGVLMGVLATRGLKNVKCVETYHSCYSHYWLENKVLSFAISMYIPCSESAKKEFIYRFHPNQAKVTTISNGVNRNALINQVTEVQTDGQFSAVSVGRFTDQKNLQVTAAAFAEIMDEKFIYKIYGSGPNEQQIIDAIGGSNKVKICGTIPRSKVINELANAAIVVMPSLWEGLSIVLLEALALDCPMMISDIPSLRDVFEEKALNAGEYWRVCAWGYIVDTNNVKAYKEAMEHYLRNPDLGRSMRESISNYSVRFSILETAKQYTKVYEIVLQRHNNF